MGEKFERIPDFEEIPEYELTKPDEVAIFVKDNDIFSITPASITKLFESVGFKNVGFVHIKKLNSGKESNEFVDLYSDDLGNSLFISYKPSRIELGDRPKFIIGGYSIDPFVEIYHSYSGECIKFDVRRLIENYGKNVFPKAVKKIVDKLLKKRSYLNTIFV